MTPQPEPRRRWGWGRLILGSLIALLCAAGGSAVFVVEQVHNLRDALKQNAALRTGGTLASAGWGDPQTMLLVGNDTRKGYKYYRGYVPDLANEMLLVRLDPSKPYISMMSIPRELRVTIYPPGRTPYTDRINSSYTYGIGTLVSTIKHVLGLQVNHVVVTTFARFERAINEMGCVYSTVDRRYYHVNVPGGEQYQEINLQPGYQKLCGSEARQFVSYRHGDTSLVRDARDQSFLLDVKKQYGPTLSSNIGKFENIFGKAVQTDPGLQSSTGILNLLGTLISAAGRHTRQVHFQATLGPSFDTATPQQISASVHSFLYGVSAAPPQSAAQSTAHAVHSKKAIAQLPLIPLSASALGQAQHFATGVPFTVEYPRVQDRPGSGVPVAQRQYLIHAPGDAAYPAYDAVFATSSLGQFYDVQGMTWTTAPQFDSPDQTVRVGGRTYFLFYEGSNLKMVAWYEHRAVYWIRNTLTDVLSPGEMLAIAEQTTPFAGVGPSQQSKLSLKAAGVPLEQPKRAATLTTRETVGSIAGIVTLLALPLLALLAILRIRELRRPRGQLASSGQIGSRLPSFNSPVSAPVPVPAAGIQPTLAGGRAARPGTYAPPQWSQGRRDYRKSRLRSPAGLILSLLAIGVIAAAAAYLGTRGGSTAAPLARHQSAKAAPALPNVPVSVLNATSTAGAAHQLAALLQADHVSVSQVGNVVESRPPGTEVLYSPGEHDQAQRVARLLSSRSPTVAPIDPVIAAAAGSAARVVVVIS